MATKITTTRKPKLDAGGKPKGASIRGGCPLCGDVPPVPQAVPRFEAGGFPFRDAGGSAGHPSAVPRGTAPWGVAAPVARAHTRAYGAATAVGSQPPETRS